VFQAVKHEYDNRYIDGALSNSGLYQLDVDMNRIVFSHHHLFSPEHVLSTRLAELYTEYTLRKRKNMADFLTDKVRIV
jgi:coiled-coil and C2 domain-containing protein 2A